MHQKNSLRDCRYYKNKRHYPFEELGCKFQHGSNIEVLNLKTQQKTDNFSEDEPETLEVFCTSTPKYSDMTGYHSKKQPWKCEDSHDTFDTTNCAECFVMKYIHERNRNTNGGCKINFEDW